MISNPCYLKIKKEWSDSSTLSKGLILSILFLLWFAYLPTLQFDFAFKDQLRAFTYYPLEETPYKRFKGCSMSRISFYIRSGRPLVSVLGECIEHAAVGKIEDFAYLRPLALSIATLTAIIFGRILIPLVGSWAAGIATASLFIFSPGYAFMLYLGLSAMSNLLCPLIALWSYFLLTKWTTNYHTNQTINPKGLLLPFLLFLTACMIYPIWAFIVIPLALVFLCFDRNNDFMQKIKRFTIILAFYFLTSIIYMIFIKFLIAINFGGSGTVDMGDGAYEISPTLNPLELIQRFITAGRYFLGQPLLNFFSGEWWVLLAPLMVTFFLTKEISAYFKKRNIFYITLFSFGALFFTLLILAGSLSPFLFSQMHPPAERFFIPWYFFSCVVAVSSFWRFYESFFKVNTIKFGLIILVFALLPASYVQNKRSFLEVTISGMEIDFLRTKLWEWLDFEGYKNARYLITFQSKNKRPAYIESLLDKDIHGLTLLEISGDPSHYYQIVTALLRERLDHPVGRSLKMHNCSYSPDCADVYLKSNPGGIVFIVATNDKPIETEFKNEVYTINFYELTKGKFEPNIESISPKKNRPKISATSQLEEYGPHGLLFKSQPGWHAAPPTIYPQSIIIDFLQPVKFQSIGLLPQDNYSSRAPKNIEVQIGNDKTSLTTLVHEENACTPNEKGGWHNIKLPEVTETRVINIKILSNCGDPSLLTLRGIKLE